MHTPERIRLKTPKLLLHPRVEAMSKSYWKLWCVNSHTSNCQAFMCKIVSFSWAFRVILNSSFQPKPTLCHHHLVRVKTVHIIYSLWNILRLKTVDSQTKKDFWKEQWIKLITLIHLAPGQAVVVIPLHSKFCKEACNYLLCYMVK